MRNFTSSYKIALIYLEIQDENMCYQSFCVCLHAADQKVSLLMLIAVNSAVDFTFLFFCFEAIIIATFEHLESRECYLGILHFASYVDRNSL